MSLQKTFYKTKQKISDNSPAICMVVGVISFVATVVLACHETTKVEEIIDEHDKNMDDIRVTLAKVNTDDPEYVDVEYDESDAKKDKFIFTCQTGWKLTKNYAPAVICGTVSLTAFLASYKILSKRYLAASALAATISEAFSKYRGRVRDELGEDCERHFYYGTEVEKITKTSTDGKKTKETHLVETMNVDKNGIPLYAKFFDEANPQWSKNPSTNLMFLKGIENRMNDKFKMQGYLLLNQVYRALDIPETDLGCEVGWFESHGDQFVDFGIFDGSDIAKRRFVNGFEPSILLSFNCVPKYEGDLEAY